ncbi:hypothetical protein B0H14DRAFT_3091781 [Mycena olivaceomarginata]|nr:hypothetical protein B0H14DRAFT_3091781 [Mycena olivaceomarginata]
MAGKQWAGEVISSKDKTTVSDEFKALEKDVELRRDGAQRLFLASEAYHRNMAKKKDNGALDDAEKLMPVDTLGIVMIIHGEEFGEDSPFGNSLVTLGRAHCKVAKLQEAFAQSFHDTFMASLVRFAEDIKDYEALRKKLESRRLSLDAANAKAEKVKNSKKEKERKDAEEEKERARFRYEEAEEEVEAHMHAIQENEIVQLRELTGLLTLELGFVEQYLDVLKETRAGWPSEWVPSLPVPVTIRLTTPTPARPQPGHTPFPSQSYAKKTGSVRSHKSSKSERQPPSRRTSEESSSDDEGVSSRPSSRPPSRSSRPPSRPSSRASRKRSDSTGTAGGGGDKGGGRRLSVAGWAAGAVGSVTGRGKNKAFTSLADEADRDSGHGESDNGSGGGGGGGLPTRILKPPSQAQRKVVRALYDFSGSSDELAFKTGDTIVVVNEVLDGWWMGELNGRQGLFPTPYTEVLPDRPQLPSRAGLSSSSNNSHERDSDDSRDMYNGRSDDEDDEDEDAAHHYGRPVTAASPFYGGPSDAASIMSSVADEDDDERNLLSELLSAGAGAQSKKAPPPPPPRRATNGGSVHASPMIPERPLRPPSRGTPASSSSGSISRSGGGYDRSPFDSATELKTSPVGASESGCTEFKQNPFKPKGMCSNCKSSLVKGFIDGNFSEAYYPTIETTATKTIMYKRDRDEFSQLKSQHAIGIHGYVLVYSIASRASFNMIQIIYDKILNYSGLSEIAAIIVGSKADLNMDRQVDSMDGQALAQRNNAAWIEVSALQNRNVGEPLSVALPISERIIY